jgi:hypothetical protein
MPNGYLKQYQLRGNLLYKAVKLTSTIKESRHVNDRATYKDSVILPKGNFFPVQFTYVSSVAIWSFKGHPKPENIHHGHSSFG